jgi:glutathione peroxidase
MKDCQGRVLLIVNVASGCGFTPQYAGLEALWRKYGERGLTVLGFPCNQFGGQEPGNEAADRRVLQPELRRELPDVRQGRCQRRRYASDLRLPQGRRPRRARFGERSSGTSPSSWLDRNGRVVGRYASSLKPEDMAADIEKLL